MNASFACPILLRSPLLDFEDVPFRIAKIGPWRPGLVVDDVPDPFDSSTKEFGTHGRMSSTANPTWNRFLSYSG
jgi:hypothetical protein